MTGPLNDPKNFADEALAGFCSAHACHVRRVTGGVVRSTRVPAGEVAVVVGGGSGHYPAYMGWVGAGFAHGAAVGNVFASPSAAYVYSVAKAADRGAGVIFGFGNYSGDVLNFRAAQQQLIAEGIDARLLIVTDDVASGTAEDGSDRRGIAGGLVVLKIAAAAASAGLEIEDVFAVGERANKRTRSIGIAYSGCTLPGASAPLFVVEDGTMAVGLGIHGEPGIETRELATADQSAALMVDRLLADAPGDVTDRVTVVLNGLGATKYEELFVVYQSVLTELKDRGLTVISPQIGEFVTSFDMAGLSLTVTWLDDELEQFWLAPADSPGFTMTEAPEEAEYQSAGDVDEESAPPPPASDESYAAAIGVADILDVVADMLAEVEHDLGELDAIAGDGDHGIGMTAGSRAAAATARDEIAQRIGAGTLLTRAGAAWAASAGGTSGLLWGAAMTTMGSALGDEEPPNADRVGVALQQALAGLCALGNAEVGDKTMIDAVAPFVTAFAEAASTGVGLTRSWQQAAVSATTAARSTADLSPRLGRARNHAAASVGHPDAGAVSFAQVVTVIGEHWGAEQ